MLTAVHEGRLTVERVVQLLSDGPRSLWGLALPPETGCTVDLEASYVLVGSRMQTKCKWSPFDGMQVYGRIIETKIRGVTVFDGETVMVAPGFGRNVWATV
jgi:carbamoyl-phosphate synthase/aspartate carbamoyltransferase/dihydroorotase